jgi:hypothetical protein
MTLPGPQLFSILSGIHPLFPGFGSNESNGLVAKKI